ncbi:hypothetical protein D3C85_1570830 [compost metagenome]
MAMLILVSKDEVLYSNAPSSFASRSLTSFPMVQELEFLLVTVYVPEAAANFKQLFSIPVKTTSSIVLIVSSFSPLYCNCPKK